MIKGEISNMNVKHKSKMSHIHKSKVWDYFMATLFILTSDVVVWHIGLTPAISMSFFFLMSFYTFCKRRKHIDRSFGIVICTFIFILTNFVFYQTSFKDNSTFGYMICLSATYFCVRSYDYFYFRDLLTNVVAVICIISIPFFILSILGILPYTHRMLAGSPWTMFGPFVYGWDGAWTRFAGIWHEPGACQLIFNIILWLHLDNIKKWRWKQGQLKKIIIILIGSLLTQSTGGYMSLMILGLAAVVDIKFRGKYQKYKIFIYPLFLMCVIFVLYFMFNSDVIQKKLFNDDESNVSKTIRTANTLALFQMSIDRPLLGYGIGTIDFVKESARLDNISSSSGILKFAACLGWIWMIIFLSYVWNGIRKVFRFKSAIFFFVAYILMMMNEDFMEFPFSNILIFSYASYGLLRKHKASRTLNVI